MKTADHLIHRRALSILLAILAWFVYLAQVIVWGVTVLISIITTLSTYPLRLLIYEYIEIPLYNAWSALHWYLAHTGFALPTDSETNPGLMTLGVAPQDAWAQVQVALNDLSGGIGAPTPDGVEPSGAGRERRLPKEVVVDTPANVSAIAQVTAADGCPPGHTPSEFLRPWRYPSKNMDGSTVLTEPTSVHLSPYPAGLDATVLTGGMAGDAGARADFESARNEKETLTYHAKHLPHAETLGGPIDFTGYVVAKLTRDHPGVIPNFNLDSDRGYAYLCWDCLRDKTALAAPAAYRQPVNPTLSGHQYHPPVAPGYGWCDDEMISGTAAAPHDPKAPTDVRIRYIDREGKFA